MIIVTIDYQLKFEKFEKSNIKIIIFQFLRIWIFFKEKKKIMKKINLDFENFEFQEFRDLAKFRIQISSP